MKAITMMAACCLLVACGGAEDACYEENGEMVCVDVESTEQQLDEVSSGCGGCGGCGVGYLGPQVFDFDKRSTTSTPLNLNTLAEMCKGAPWSALCSSGSTQLEVASTPGPTADPTD